MKSVRNGTLVCLVATGLAVISLSTPKAQSRLERRSGPRDWSHSHIVASGFSAEDPEVRRDWRTLRKHMALDEARERRGLEVEWAAWFNRIARRPAPPTNAGTSDVKLDWALSTGGTGSVVGYPAKYNFDVSASNCSDVIYFTVNQSGTSSAPNVIAMTNAYAGCPGNPANLTPTVKWAIALPNGTGTSPTLSLDGKVLYVFESPSSGNAVLHAIQVNNITTNVGAYNYNSKTWTSVHTLSSSPIGTASSEQLFSMTFSNTVNVLSSPYFDYDNKRIYFGDNTGRIHRINNAQSNTAAEASGWPITCTTRGFQSPMLYNDQVVAGNTNGYLYRIDVSVGSPACVQSQRLGGGTQAEGNPGGLTSPTIDVTNSKILVTTGDTAVGEFKALAVFRLNFAAGEAPVAQVTLGAADSVPAQFPALDNDFWTNNDGNVYAVGTMSTANTMLVRVPYNGATLLTPEGFAVFHRATNSAGASVGTSPVVEFLTAAAVSNPDFIFVGGNGTNYNFINRISSNFNGNSGAPVAMDGWFAPTSGVSSGISVDTRTTSTTGTTATANIYFGTAGGSVNSMIVQLAQQF
jgi:hypothetical protein